MSIIIDDPEKDLTVKELLELILEELRIIRLHNEVITDQVFKNEDARR